MSTQTNFLAQILDRKRMRLDAARAARSLEALRSRALEVRRSAQPHALRRALESDGSIKVIAEIKRASPSKGKIKVDVDPTELARTYSRGGAAAISVLTEEDYFLGSLDDLRAVRAATFLPVLCKDFIFDEHQIYEIAEAGADALLLIVAALEDERLSALRRVAEDELGMDALVEVHTKEEMRRALCSGARLIGVNNRNLHTFEVSIDVSVELADEATGKAFLVSESGLNSSDDLRRLRALGYNAFLIGEMLMRAGNPAETLQMLIRESESKVRVKVCGIANLEDALMCVRAGVDMLGFNFFPGSPRYIAPGNARRIVEQLPPEILSVGIFVNEDVEQVARIAELTSVGAVQLHGDETPEYCHALNDRFVIKALRVGKDFKPEEVAKYETAAVLLDAFSSTSPGGTGQRFDWSLARETARFVSKLILAGGLTPENIAEALAVVQPFAVDVCSSLESAPGKKSEERVRAFITSVREAPKRNIRISSLPDV